MEIDGGGGRQKKSRGAKNTINGHDESSWRMKSPRQLMHCGEAALSGDREIQARVWRSRHPEVTCHILASHASQNVPAGGR